MGLVIKCNYRRASRPTIIELIQTLNTSIYRSDKLPDSSSLGLAKRLAHALLTPEIFYPNESEMFYPKKSKTFFADILTFPFQ